MDIERLAALTKGRSGLYSKVADAIGNPDRVWCRECGRSGPVNAAHALRHGWPKCCGYTMTIDEPDDR